MLNLKLTKDNYLLWAEVFPTFEGITKYSSFGVYRRRTWTEILLFGIIWG